MPKEIWTIGHSTHPLEEFLAWLQAFKSELLVDVRSYPGSRKMPWFNKEVLPKELKSAGIEYVHIRSLGGRGRCFRIQSTRCGGIPRSEVMRTTC